jgi:hypothetical protein
VLTFAAVERKEPPGALLRYDGRLTTPSACLRIVNGFIVFPSVFTAMMRYLSETPASRVIRLWFDRDCQLVQLIPIGRFRQNACPRRNFGHITFCFLLCDEKL